jgi:hypothetical protein
MLKKTSTMEPAKFPHHWQHKENIHLKFKLCETWNLLQGISPKITRSMIHFINKMHILSLSDILQPITN